MHPAYRNYRGPYMLIRELAFPEPKQNKLLIPIGDIGQEERRSVITAIREYFPLSDPPDTPDFMAMRQALDSNQNYTEGTRSSSRSWYKFQDIPVEIETNPVTIEEKLNYYRLKPVG